eukprot:scaffold259317_cov18-Tisochrysis_lutea.AAC.2
MVHLEGKLDSSRSNSPWTGSSTRLGDCKFFKTMQELKMQQRLGGMATRPRSSFFDLQAHLHVRNKLHPAHIKKRSCRLDYRSACKAEGTTCASSVEALNAQLLYEEQPPHAPHFIGPIKIMEMPGGVVCQPL